MIHICRRNDTHLGKMRVGKILRNTFRSHCECEMGEGGGAGKGRLLVNDETFIHGHGTKEQIGYPLLVLP